MKNRIYSLLFLGSVFLVVSCKLRDNNNSVIEFDSIDLSESNIQINPLDTVGEGLPIFYNMYLSVELSTLFESAGAVFKPELMHNTDKISEYLTSAQQAVNLGIYAVDLTYARVFNQAETGTRYFLAMQQLSSELGIPGDYFENTAKRFERNISNKDSLISIANEVYFTTEEFLRSNERYTTSAMAVMGGWVEAIHIAIDVVLESGDIEIIERFVDQKYSLNNLMIMLSEHKDNEIMSGYLKELSEIKIVFDKVEVSLDSDFDSESGEGQKQIKKAIRQITELGSIINSFRNKLVN